MTRESGSHVSRKSGAGGSGSARSAVSAKIAGTVSRNVVGPKIGCGQSNHVRIVETFAEPEDFVDIDLNE